MFLLIPLLSLLLPVLLLFKLLICDDEPTVDPITDTGREMNPREIWLVVTK